MTWRRRVRAARADGDRGVVMIIVAVSLVALATIAALVIDLGYARQRKHGVQHAADLAALAAGYQLSGRGNAYLVSDPRRACTAALGSVKENLTDFASGATLACDSFPVTGVSPDCTDSTPMTTVSTTSAGYTLRVDYPVPDAEIADAAFSGGIGTGDGVRCDRMKVSISQDKSTFLAGVAGIGHINVSGSAVVKGSVEATRKSTPALLMLERTGCQVLTNSSNGTNGSGIIVEAATTQEGGHAHVDTDGSECDANPTKTAYAVYGTPLSTGQPSIQVKDGSGTNGSITAYAVTAGSTRGGWIYPGGLSKPVTAGPIVSRQPVDNTYNLSPDPAISTLHASAYSAVNMPTASATANGYSVVDCTAKGPVTGTKVFVNCPIGYTGAGDVTFTEATDVVFNGPINMKSGTMAFPVANRVYVKANSTAGITLGNGANFTLNLGTATDCSARQGPAAGGTTTNTSVLAVMGGPAAPTHAIETGNSSLMRLCQTTVYLGSSAGTYSRFAATSGGNCTVAAPCPVKSGAAPGSTYSIGGTLQLYAPNQVTGQDASHPLDDLALWSESSDTDQAVNSGLIDAQGIMFTPNAPIQFQSPASATPHKAQIIARTLNLLQGTLDLNPVEGDSVAVPLPGSYGLIR